MLKRSDVRTAKLPTMKKLDRILVVLEPFEPIQPALERAEVLAERTGAALELYCVDFNEALSGDPRIDTTVLRELRDKHTKRVLDWLADIREKTAESGGVVAAECEYGRPDHEHILRRARELQPDLIIKSTRFHSALERNYFGASDWHLIKHSTAPLLFVKRRELPAQAPVLMAVDPFHPADAAADLDMRILESGAFLADALRTPLHAVHVVAPLPRIDRSEDSRYELLETEAATIEDHRRAVRELSRVCDINDDRIHVLVGRPAEAIGRLATEIGAGTIVMGAISRGNLLELFVGNTAERVLEEVNADVLVLHPGSG
jgi:universal stress protein E